MKSSILVSIFFLCFNLSEAASYYVSNTGSDSNNGTSPSTPWQTISKVNTVNFAPGDNLYFKGGETFSGNIYLSSSDGNSPTIIFTISSYGTGRAIINAGNSYGISAYNTQGIRVENLILNGSGMSTNTQDGLSFYADLAGNVKLKGLSFDNIEVKNFGKTGVKIGSWNGNTGYENMTLNNLDVHDNHWDGILVYGFIGYNNYVGYPHKNITITNCKSYNNPGIADPNAIRGNGIVLSNTEGGLIENCKAYNNGANNVHCGGPGGIWVYDAKGIVIQYNESYSNRSMSTCDGLGFDLDGGSINCVMQYNYSHDNDGGGYLLGQMENGRPWKNNICRYNISQNDGRHNAAGITLFKEGSTTIMDSCFVYNNTVYMTPAANNNGEAAFKITTWFTGITNVKVYNNIFVTTGGAPLVDVPSGYSGYFAGNLYWPSGSPFLIKYQGTNYSSLSAWRSATNNEMVGITATGITANPLLTNIGAGGTLNPNPTNSLAAYQLQTGSPAIDAGLNLSSAFGFNVGANDYWGDPVLSGSQYDIGADEKAGNVTTCNVPSALSAAPSSTSAVLSWTNTGAVSYNLQYKLSSATAWITINGVSSPYTLSGLTACSNYQFQVQSVCSTSQSAYSSPTSFTTTGCTQPYCTSYATNTSKEHINKVQLGTINNLSGNNNGYGNFISMSTNLQAGIASTISLTPGFAAASRNELWDVYIDYNQNGSFSDAGEKVATGASIGVLSKTFTVPITSLNGTTRMRVQMRYKFHASGPCAVYTYGEVEDYSVTISGANANRIYSDEKLIQGIENSFVVIYPNPTTNNFTIKNISSSETLLQIINSIGEVVFSENISGKNEYEVRANLSKGIYFVRAGNLTRKLIVQ